MKYMRNWFAAALVGVSLGASAAGLYPGFPARLLQNLSGSETWAVDTNLGGGVSPQTMSISLNQVRGWERTPLTTFAATLALDYNVASNYIVTLTGNTTIANPLNPIPGGVVKYILTQDATGTRTITPGSLFKFAGGTPPTFSTTAGYTDLLTCTYNMVNYDCVTVIGAR